jgi:ATP-dependent protease ClpP protease subunit
VVSHSRISENYFRKLMAETETLANDIGSIIDGREACACGLIDQIGGIKEAISYLYGRMEINNSRA